MINYAKPKITAQDKPITITQVRKLRENLDVLKWCNRSTIMVASWTDEFPFSAAGDFHSPPCWIPVGAVSVALYLHVYNDGASSVTRTITFSFGDDEIEYEMDPIAAGDNYYFTLLPIDPSLWGRWISITGGQLSPSTDLYYKGIGIWAYNPIVSTDGNIGLPAWGDVADSRVLRLMAEELRDLNINNPQHLCTNLDHYTVSVDAYAYDYRGYWLADQADDSLSEDSTYLVQIRPGKTTGGSYACETRVDATESSDYEVATYLSNNTTEDSSIPMQVDAESWLTGSPYSSLSISPIKVAGLGTTEPVVNGLNVWLSSASAPSTARQQGAYRTLCDLDYFDIKTNEHINYDKQIAGLAAALHNSYANRVGAMATYMPAGGYTISLTTSYQTICTLPLYVPNRWDAGTIQGRISVLITWIIKNDSANSRDIDIRATELQSGSADTITDTVTIAAGVRDYRRFTGTFDLLYTGGDWYCPVKIELKADDTVKTIVSCLTIARYSGTSY